MTSIGLISSVLNIEHFGGGLPPPDHCTISIYVVERKGKEYLPSLGLTLQRVNKTADDLINFISQW